ncbi:hypothetical protein [Dechloromonas sp. CZR5]|uniref:hypothetical protein n=1 Tax=Dechloromonas sp. CZR5 TaxID=2608630 RepID=UPI00168AC9AB|nr:hypothetical protein [Dechloromonas sp. CZR5]
MTEYRSRNPTFKEAVEIITNCSSRREQIRQLQFMEQTQGREFAEGVAAKVKASGWVKKS